MRETATETSMRIGSLDGLRGIAAVMVLFDHTFLMIPSLAHVYDQRVPPEAGTSDWWLAMTPLHALWAGQEAVYLFFVLSGLVLTLAVIRTPDFDWFAYYPRRVIRLYVPAWAAVALAALSMALVPRQPDERSSSWLARRASEFDLGTLRTDLTLLFGGDGFGLSPLWSLRWEVLFSLLLPLFVIAAVGGRRLWPVKLLGLAGILAIGAYTGWGEFRCLAMFGIGSLLAAHWDRIGDTVGRALRSSLIGAPAFAVAIALFTARWWGVTVGVDPAKDGWLALLALAGAVLLVLLAAYWPVAQGFLQWRPVHWLGLISFSLYLVHESVIIAVRYLLIDHSMVVVTAIGVPLAILCAWLFHLAVEKPSNRLARRAGHAVSQRSANQEPVHPQIPHQPGPPVEESLPRPMAG